MAVPVHISWLSPGEPRHRGLGRALPRAPAGDREHAPFSAARLAKCPLLGFPAGAMSWNGLWISLVCRWDLFLEGQREGNPLGTGEAARKGPPGQCHFMTDNSSLSLGRRLYYSLFSYATFPGDRGANVSAPQTAKTWIALPVSPFASACSSV